MHTQFFKRILKASPWVMLLFLAAAPAHAVRTESLTLGSLRDYLSGTFENVALTSNATLQPAPTVNLIASLPGAQVITASAYHAASSTLYIATGTEGKIFALNIHQPGAEPTLVYSAPEPLVASIAVSPLDGALYVATSPSGAVYRLQRGARPEVYFKAEGAAYIWHMAFNAEGALYIAIGGSAHVYRLPPNFTPSTPAQLLFSPELEHLNTFTLAGENLYAAAGPGGYIYKLPLNNKKDNGKNNEGGEKLALKTSKLIAVTGADEITRLHVAPSGDVYAAQFFGKGGPELHPEEGGANQALANALSAALNAAQKKEEQNKLSPVRPALVRINKEGFVTPIHALPGLKLFSFLPQNNRAGWLLGTGDKGRLVSYQPGTQNWKMTYERPDGGQVSAIVPTSKGTALLMSNPAEVYFMPKPVDSLGVAKASPKNNAEHKAQNNKDGDAGKNENDENNEKNVSSLSKHIFISKPLDAGNRARWGKLNALQHGSVRFETRSGMSPTPNEHWSAWQPLSPAGSIESMPGRYIQIKAVLGQGENTDENAHELAAELLSARVFYAYANQAPEVRAVNALPGAYVPSKGKNLSLDAPIPFRKLLTADGNDSAEHSASNGAGSSGSAKGSGSSAPSSLRQTNQPGVLTILWDAKDANDDTLSYTLEMRPVAPAGQSTNWVTIASNVRVQTHQMHVEGLEEGYYRFRVTATDAPSNTPTDALNAQEVSAPQLVDHSAPTVHVQRVGEAKNEGAQRFRITATDAFSTLASAHYAINGEDTLHILKPETDGLMDSTEETFTANLSEHNLRPGLHTLTVFIEDASGNLTQRSTVFEVRLP